jgi:thiamine pyrophosphate-dependent acetolactate synthase large subunit-like protein
LVNLAGATNNETMIAEISEAARSLAAKPRDGNLYAMGMGLVAPFVLGLALSLPHRGVVALDGDGSILLNLVRSPCGQLCSRQFPLGHF